MTPFMQNQPVKDSSDATIAQNTSILQYVAKILKEFTKWGRRESYFPITGGSIPFCEPCIRLFTKLLKGIPGKHIDSPHKYQTTSWLMNVTRQDLS